MLGYWPMTEAALGTTAGPQIDIDAAQVLFEAGYMPLADYIALYGVEAPQRRMRRVNAGDEQLSASRRRHFMHPKRLRRPTSRKRNAG